MDSEDLVECPLRSAGSQRGCVKLLIMLTSVSASEAPDDAVRIIDAFDDELGLAGFGFARVQRPVAGRLGCAPVTMLKLYV